jgi:uncharacterized protein (UPF0548 family)
MCIEFANDANRRKRKERRYDRVRLLTFGSREPAKECLRAFIASQESMRLTYDAVGATAGELPRGFRADQMRMKVGEGEEAFAAARRGLRRWEQFRLGWIEPWPGDAPIEAGKVVAVMARVCGLWWVNACRIVYVVEEDGDGFARFGFAYGTLPGHAESGEERFLVEWDQRDGSVWYSILAFSRPRHWLAKVAYPMTRRLQARFRRDSAAAMVRAVAKVVTT